MKDFKFTNFKKRDIPLMRKAFNQAFSDYLIPMKLGETAFRRKIVEKTNIKFKLSVGSYYKKKLVGFVFHTVNQYENKLTAYNGGTGVIPEFRGHRLTHQMYDYIIPTLVKNDIEKCVLEVVSTNKAAIRSYEGIGFRKSKFFHCMKMNMESKYLRSLHQKRFNFTTIARPNWETYGKFCDHSSSFLDSFPMLKNNLHNEKVIEASDGEKIIGFLIFNPRMGRIENLGVDRKYRGQGIGSLLVRKMHQSCRYKPIYILNLNEKYYGLLSFFLRIGFKNDIDQFELKLNLPRNL